MNSLLAIKVVSMVTMFAMIAIVGNIPLRSKAFKENPLLLSLTGAFSGGLFLSVGIIHLLPESIAQFYHYFENENMKPLEQFPYACLITVLSFALILYIEKIAFVHNHNPGDHKSMEMSSVNQQENEQETENQDTPKQKTLPIEENNLTPYILQVAIGKNVIQLGIHAFFEGLAIGIEQQVPQCLGISLAVICHKWAEGLTLGLSFRKAGTNVKSATIMIMIQAIINPLGILAGWILTNQGFIVTGIFQSISAGTFVYIATMEVIQEQFSDQSNRKMKMVMFLLAIGFISSIWTIEKLTVH